jgi:hypothetical protein
VIWAFGLLMAARAATRGPARHAACYTHADIDQWIASALRAEPEVPITGSMRRDQLYFLD